MVLGKPQADRKRRVTVDVRCAEYKRQWHFCAISEYPSKRVFGCAFNFEENI